jgi:hypothetical protein
MSTPLLSRDKKLQGLDLYAPRRSAQSAAGLRGAPTRLRSVGSEAEPSLTPENDEFTDEGHDGEDADTLSEGNDAAPAPDREHDEDFREFDWPHENETPYLDEFAGADEEPMSSRPDDDDGRWPPSDSGFSAAPRAPWRRASLEPDIVPYPAKGTAYGAFPRLLVRFSVVASAAAIAAFGLLYIASGVPEGRSVPKKLEANASDTPIAPDAQLALAVAQPVLSKLHIDDRQGFVNEPLPLEAFVDPSTGHETLLFDGLKAGTQLSAGTAVGPSAWQLPSENLKGLFLYAPKDFVGVMDAAVDLVSPSRRILDRRAIKLAWITKSEIAPPPADAPDPSPRKESAAAAAAAAVSVSAEQTAVLMKRAQDAFNAGDVTGARLTFGRLAEAGNADAVLALAATYDSRELAKRNVVGFAGDSAKALSLYQRAAELGSARARLALEGMAAK